MLKLSTKSFDHGSNSQESNKKLEAFVKRYKNSDSEIMVKQCKDNVYALRKRYNDSKRSEIMQVK